ncbi:NHL repeat-containing protein [Gaopeijia maritima]|uniref:6-bladed beta-propeller n=1 Tax=Gaopeijia maritima TaxID=3119007 RepID=A0ABU9E5Q2_9BACT
MSESPFLVVSSRETTPAERFSSIAGAVWTSGGHLAVADAGAQEIRVFDAEGAVVQVASGPGDAPGEFRGLAALYPFRGDSLVAFDRARGRAVILNDLGNVARSIGLEGAVSAQGVGVSEEGWIAVLGTPSPVLEVGLHADSAPLMVFDLADGRADTVGVFTVRERFVVERRGNRSMGERPFGRAFVGAVDADRILTGEGDRFEVMERTVEGEPRAAIRRLHEAVEVDAPHRDRYVEWRLSGFRGDDGFARTARSVLSSPSLTPYPDHLPAFDRLLVDTEHHLWVRHYLPPWSETRRVWSVFDPERRWLGEVMMPAGFELLEVAHGMAVGIHRDPPTRPLNIPTPSGVVEA